MDKNTLNDIFAQYKVAANVVGVRQGPAVSRYEVELGRGAKLNDIKSIMGDIARIVGDEHIQLISPLDKGLVGIDIPRDEREFVEFGEIFDEEILTAPLSTPIGKDMDGNIVTADLSKMPHLLVAGATGSGKSVFINTVICSAVAKNTPQELRLILIDPKQVELSVYAGLPHLARPIVTDPAVAGETLRDVVEEMDSRYALMARHGVRNLAEFNAGVDNGMIKHDKLPLWLIIIDELADLMMVARREVESSIVRITQLARAAGMHLIVATQRPSVDVITGLIKANMPSRLAFAVASKTDSRVILDQMGAEMMTGMGDSLFVPQGSRKPIRVQGAFISSEEIEKIVSAWETFVWTEEEVKVSPELIRRVQMTANNMQYVSVPMIETMFDLGHKEAKAVFKSLDHRMLSYA
jgi:S-DNA-T family DNA segregation ATPase FtsK/SpoIIIE